jgi:hypothetical protein
MASYKIFLRNDAPRKNGSIGVYLRVRIGNKKKDFPFMMFSFKEKGFSCIEGRQTEQGGVNKS